MAFYTVHLKDADPSAPAKDPDANLVLVRDGFAWGAMLFSFLWAGWHRMWGWAALLIAAYFGSSWALLAMGAPHGAHTAVHLAIPVGFGFMGAALRRRSLARRGFREVGGVSAAGINDAEERYLMDAGVPRAPWGAS